MPKGNIDPNAVSVKVVVIDGEEYNVNVMAPGPEVHDEMVWRFPKPNTLGFFTFQELNGDSPTWILDSGYYRLDHQETFASI